MFTNLVKVGYDFPACHDLIFHRPSATLDADPCSAHLETILSSLSA